jgi:hypothetical protein
MGRIEKDIVCAVHEKGPSGKGPASYARDFNGHRDRIDYRDDAITRNDVRRCRGSGLRRASVQCRSERHSCPCVESRLSTLAASMVGKLDRNDLKSTRIGWNN